jgi:hypothetical protein
MPKPVKNETEQDFLKRCIPQVINERTAGDEKQAFAVCQNIWNGDKGVEMEELSLMLPGKKDKMQIDGEKSLMKGIEVVDLKPAHILSSGTWQAQTGEVTITEADIDQMIENFEAKIVEPVLNIDHDDTVSDKMANFLKVAALGYVKQLDKRIEGKTAKLFASFRQVPLKIAEMIEAGLIKQRSPEFWKTLKRGGEIYHHVLKAVSFFGAELPAGILDDYVEVFKSTDKDSNGVVTNLKTKETSNMSDVTVTKAEYEGLVKAKHAADTFEVKLNAAEKQNETLQAENVKLSAEVEEAKKLKADIETEKAEMLRSEAVKYIGTQVEAGKLLPKFQDSYVEDYVLKAADEKKLSLFKEDIENREKVVELGAVATKTAAGETAELSAEDMKDSVKVDEYLNQLSAKEGITYKEAAKKIGLNFDRS